MIREAIRSCFVPVALVGESRPLTTRSVRCPGQFRQDLELAPFFRDLKCSQRFSHSKGEVPQIACKWQGDLEILKCKSNPSRGRLRVFAPSSEAQVGDKIGWPNAIKDFFVPQTYLQGCGPHERSEAGVAGRADGAPGRS